MVVQDARPSAFTQLATTAEWESFVAAAGIHDGPDSPSSFVPTLNTVGRSAILGPGRGLIKGQLWSSDEAISLQIPTEAAQPRLDRLVLQLNRTALTAESVVQPVLVAGTPAATPSLPSLIQTDSGLYQIPISYWTSAANGTLTGLVDQRQYTYTVPGEQMDFFVTGQMHPVNPSLLGRRWPVYARDAKVGTKYIIKAWGNGVWANPAQPFNIRGNWHGAPLATVPFGAGLLNAGLAYHYWFETEVSIRNPGPTASYISITRGMISNSAGTVLVGNAANNAISAIRLQDGGSINTAVDGEFAMDAWYNGGTNGWIVSQGCSFQKVTA